MTTLNYWLGKLQRLQLFGHGIKEIAVQCDWKCKYQIVDVTVEGDVVTIHIKE